MSLESPIPLRESDRKKGFVDALKADPSASVRPD
jgi:hypothetical protein